MIAETGKPELRIFNLEDRWTDHLGLLVNIHERLTLQYLLEHDNHSQVPVMLGNIHVKPDVIVNEVQKRIELRQKSGARKQSEDKTRQ